MLIAHLSDTHITVTGPSVELAQQAILRVMGLDPLPDCIVITGDIVDNGAPAEYELVASVVATAGIPVHLVPGNHDDAATMVAVLGGEAYYRVEYPGLRILALDSSVPGRFDGALGAEQLAWLDAELGAAGDDPVILALHHHPVPSGIATMDKMGLVDAPVLAGVLSRHRPPVRILHGHLHRNVTTSFAGAVVTCAPSTLRQLYLDLAGRPYGSFVNEPAGFLLHDVRGTDVVTHYVPIRDTGPAMGRFGAPAQSPEKPQK